MNTRVEVQMNFACLNSLLALINHHFTIRIEPIPLKLLIIVADCPQQTKHRQQALHHLPVG